MRFNNNNTPHVCTVQTFMVCKSAVVKGTTYCFMYCIDMSRAQATYHLAANIGYISQYSCDKINIVITIFIR